LCCRYTTGLRALRVKKPPAGVEPAPRPYDGRVLAVDTTEARNGDGRTRTDISRVASAALCPIELHPRVRKAADRIRTGTARITTSDADRYTTATMLLLEPTAAWRGWDSNPRSQAHEACEDSHSSTARRLRRTIWPAGVEPAISGSRSRRGGHAPLRPDENVGGGTTFPQPVRSVGRRPSGAIRCLSARLPATTVDRQRYALPP
jgi:hypothetical protein